MATVICHLLRSDRGAVLRGIRLVGLQDEAVWTAAGAAPGVDPAEAVITSVREAAAWIVEQAPALNGGRARRIDRLCLDVDGAVCSWVTAPGGDPTAAQAEAQRLVEPSAAESESGFDAAAGFDAPRRFPDLQDELSLQPLAPPALPSGPATNRGAATLARFRGMAGRNGPGPARPAPGSKAANAALEGMTSGRVGVLATPDVPARMLLDELDRRGVECGAAVSLWHAAAAVWDPGAPRARPGGTDEAVSTSEVRTAVVLVDGDDARLVWCWSRAGVPEACGSMRLPSAAPGGVLLGEAAAGRLAAEWMSWSAQLSAAPERVVCVVPGRSGGAGAEAAADFGRRMAALWPGATLDMIDDADPVGLTLRRFAERIDSGRDPLAGPAAPAAAALRSLSERPGRAHRWMYRWGAAALVLGGVAVAALGWQLRSASKGFIARAASDRERQVELLLSVDAKANKLSPRNEMQRLVNEAKTRVRGKPPFEPPKPILEELDALAFVLGNPEYELTLLSFSDFLTSVKVVVPTTAAYEDLVQAIDSVDGRSTQLENKSIKDQGEKKLVELSYKWLEETTQQ